jgi:hypothetical protein
VRLRKPPPKVVGAPPYAAAYAHVLPASHREALRDAAIAYLDECLSAIAEAEPGRSYGDTQSACIWRSARRATTTAASLATGPPQTPWSARGLPSPVTSPLRASRRNSLSSHSSARHRCSSTSTRARTTNGRGAPSATSSSRTRISSSSSSRTRRDRGNRVGARTRRGGPQVQRMVPTIRRVEPRRAPSLQPRLRDLPTAIGRRERESRAQVAETLKEKLLGHDREVSAANGHSRRPQSTLTNQPSKN